MPVLDRFSLEGRRALVTGAGRGIGRVLARALAEAGARVAVTDIDGAAAGDAAEELGSAGARALALRTDVTNPQQVDEMVAGVVAAWGGLDVAINNAGVARRSPAESIPVEDWDFVLGVNLRGVFLCCRAEGRVMLRQGAGSIINVASMSGRIANRPQQHAHYNASKAGVVQLTRSCAAEWAGRGVRVNSLSPGHTVTPMTQATGPEMRAVWVQNTPMGRLGDPADLQGAAVFLASEASAYVTGHDLIVDGGYTLW
ncbi:MAG: SDR family oxidoreductase [Candidatus Latescibacterota bacterium]